MRPILLCLSLLLLTVSPSAHAQTVPNTFSNGSVADADQVNANFEALRASLSTGLATYPPYDCFRGGFCGVDGFNSGFYISHTGASSACGTDASTQSGLLWSAGVNVSQTIQLFVPGPYSLPPCDEDPATTADVTGLIQFQNGTTAYADEINANFLTLQAGIETCLAGVASGGNQGTTCGPGELWDGVACVVPQCDVTVNDVAIYDGGFAAGVLSVDIRTDNGALCTSAGGTYDSGTNTCTVDITTDNDVVAETTCTNAGGTWTGASCTAAPPPESNDQTICEAAGGTWDGGFCIAAPTPESNDETVCTSAGGTWNAGTSTCTPAPAASSYSCFVGGFCAQAAIDFPPGDFGYTNVYEGHTQGTEPALGAGCNLIPGSFLWDDGRFVSLDISVRLRFMVEMCH